MSPVSRETSPLVSLEPVLEIIFKSQPVRWLFSCLKRKEPAGLSGLSLSALLLILASFLRERNSPFLLVAPDESVAEKLYLGAYTLLKGESFYLARTPDHKATVPGFDIEPERYLSEALQALDNNTIGLYFTSPESLLQPVVPQKEARGSVLDLKIGDVVNRDQILKRLAEWNYELADFCVSPKSYASRGGILDLFLPYARHPVRIEFFGNTIESIRLYDPSTQRSVGIRKSVQIHPPPFWDHQHSGVPLSNRVDQLNCIKLYIIHNHQYDIHADIQASRVRSLSVEPFSLVGHTLEVRNEILNRALVKYRSECRFYFGTFSGKAPALHQKLRSIPVALPAGFHSKDLGVFCLTRVETSGIRVRGASRWKIDSSGIKHEKISSLKSLSWGDYLVHQDYGIGVYRGLAKVGNDTAIQENIKIEYQDGFVYVPIDSFKKVHRYVGLGNSIPKLTVLGSGQWERQKAITRKSAQAVVDTLVSIYRARSRPRGFSYSTDTEFLSALRNSFPYEETRDQASAIQDVLNDMDKPVPMDRLVYGDVGFGKTEVALRAAVKATISGKLVFFLTPTTLLADQHYITCKNRLQPLGITVDLLSRFRSRCEQIEIIHRLKEGKIDILVGTHRLLSGDLDLSNLGLLILDEEHRFGVKHKETIRQLKTKVDVLTLTATPIPRTLQQSLIGIKEISKIETAPKERLPISTWVKYFDWEEIYTMIEKELARDGQVYFLHNDIESMPFYFQHLKERFSSSRIAMAHGKMTSRELERTILSFFTGDIDILICTTIIESGLDISSANTIIINNAQKFGLAQLYQIRGRVGRSEQQAHCYLLIPRNKDLSPEAYQRLKAIETYSALGSGYNIALKDLEIRGAGNLFGFEQSGHITRVGFEMYSKIVKEAVENTLNETNQSPEASPVRVSFDGHAFIPPDFIPIVQERLSFYQRLAEAETLEQIASIHEELNDRYGQIPVETQSLFEIARVRVLFQALPVETVTIVPESVSIKINRVPEQWQPSEFISHLKALTADAPQPWTIRVDANGFISVKQSVSSLPRAFECLNTFAGLFSNALVT